MAVLAVAVIVLSVMLLVEQPKKQMCIRDSSNEMVGKGASKIYALASKHGMRCRRLTWNPNYKGIDDWQLALRRNCLLYTSRCV